MNKKKYKMKAITPEMDAKINLVKKMIEEERGYKLSFSQLLDILIDNYMKNSMIDREIMESLLEVIEEKRKKKLDRLDNF